MGLAIVPFERALGSSYKLSIHIIPLSALICPKFQIAVLSGGCANPQFWGRGSRRVGGGTVRKSVGEQAVHSNFCSIFTRFRDIAAFVLQHHQHATFSLPHLQSESPLAQISPMFSWEQVDLLLATKSEGVRLIVRAISFQDFQPM